MSLDFRKIYLPYCLLKHASGGYIVLNRNYKPIGFSTNEYLIYEDYPIGGSLQEGTDFLSMSV